MKKAIITQLIPSAAYIRMSTSRQEDSPERQRRQISEYATRHGYQVLRWYEDHGMSGTDSRNRADYQQLIADSTTGAFQAVLIAELSRMSREDLFSVIPQWGAFKDAGITLVSCQRGVIDFSSMGGFLCAIIDQYSAHDESRKFADRTVTGKLNRVLRGDRVDGNRLFAFDRNIVDAAGNVLKRVSFRDKFVKSIDCQSVLVPSAETAAVNAVQWGFQHIATGGSLTSVVREFNRRGLKGTNGREFSISTVRTILTNPAYAGNSRAGVNCRGKFRRISDTHSPIVTESTHAGIVDRQTFETVSSIIETRTSGKEKWKTYLLSGLCRCGHCGGKLAGNHLKTQAHRYICSHAADGRSKHCDVHPSFDGPMVETAVIKAWCDVFLIDEVAAQLKMKPAADHSQHEQNELKTIGEQIAKAETNLALASTPADFKTVSGVLSQLRDREAALRDKLSKANRKLADLSPEIMKAVQQLKNARNILIDWPNIGDADDRAQLLRDLAVVFKMTISSIVLRTDLMPSAAAYGLKDFKRRTGVLSFNSEHITADDAVLTDAMLSHPFRRQYRKIADHLRDFGAPATERDLAAHIGKSDVRAVTRALLACEVDGLVKKTETGWVLSH